MAYNVYFNGDKLGPIELNQAEGDAITPIANRLVSARVNESNYQIDCIDLDITKKTITLRIEGKVINLELKDEIDETVDQLGMEAATASVSSDVIAPMPGKVIDILVAQGDSVTEGSPLVILEAMKMENILKATGPGIVNGVDIKVGETVEKGALLISMEK